jgi:hypothetical protein
MLEVAYKLCIEATKYRDIYKNVVVPEIKVWDGETTPITSNNIFTVVSLLLQFHIDLVAFSVS